MMSVRLELEHAFSEGRTLREPLLHGCDPAEVVECGDVRRVERQRALEGVPRLGDRATAPESVVRDDLAEEYPRLHLIGVAAQHLTIETLRFDGVVALKRVERGDRKSTRLNSSHGYISYAVF